MNGSSATDFSGTRIWPIDIIDSKDPSPWVGNGMASITQGLCSLVLGPQCRGSQSCSGTTLPPSKRSNSQDSCSAMQPPFSLSQSHHVRMAPLPLAAHSAQYRFSSAHLLLVFNHCCCSSRNSSCPDSNEHDIPHMVPREQHRGTIAPVFQRWCLCLSCTHVHVCAEQVAPAPVHLYQSKLYQKGAGRHWSFHRCLV